MIKFVMLCIAISLCHANNAQNKISGKITGEDNLPLAGTTISIPEINKSTLSDEKGNYVLSNLPSGKIRLQYSFLGYANKIETVVMNGTAVTMDVVLQQSALEAEEIVVTGGYNTTQHENAVKIDVLKLTASHNKPTPNFADVLTKVPGVDMISKGSGISKPVIRGLSMNDILVLNNGVRFENYQYSSHHPLGIDEFGIDNVEIIKGPASLLYGSDAIGGVINFIKEKPAATGSITGDYNLQLFTNTLGMTNNLGLKGASGNFFGGLRIGQKTNSDYLQGGGDYVPNTRFNEHSVKTNAGYAGNLGSFKLYYDYNLQKLGLAEEEAIEAIGRRGRRNEIFYQQLNTHLISSLNKLYLGSMKMDVNSAFQTTELSHVGEAKMYELQMMLATLTYETKLYLPSDAKSEYIVGFQGMNQRNENLNNRETLLLPNATTNNYSGFCLLQRTFFNRLKLQTGLRYDTKTMSTKGIGAPSKPDSYRAAIDKSYGSFSGSLGTTYNVSKELLFRGNFATAYRTPNLAELTSNGQHEVRYEVGQIGLTPENAYETDLSVHCHKENFTIDLAGFYNLINNYIYISPTGNRTASGVPIYQYEQNNSTLMGGEAGIHLHPRQIAWFHLESTYSTVKGKQTNGNYLPFVPANKIKTEARCEKKRLWLLHEAFVAVNSTIVLEQHHIAPDESPTNGYTLFDVHLGGNIKLEKQLLYIGIGATNIFDKKYIDHLSTLKEVNMLEPGRNISLTMRIPFGVGN